MTITLRPALDTDAPALVFLMHIAFQEYTGVLVPPSGVHQETEASVRDKMRTGRWLIAERQGQSVGCVFYEPRGEYLYMGRLAVPPEFRGHGIATALIGAVEAAAVEANIPCVRLGTRIPLAHLIAMYEKRGYRIIAYETHAGYSEPTYVTMQKVLATAPQGAV